MQRFLLVILAGAACLSAQTKFASVPAAYQDIYSNLSTQISSFRTAVLTSSTGAASPAMSAPQLISADSCQFSQLIAPGYYNNFVIPALDELIALGAKAVTVHIDFPVLYQPYYVSNPSQYQEYVNFYQQLAVDVHARGLKLIIESSIGQAFPGNEADTFATYLKGLSWTAYMAGRAQNALNVVELVQPDYMSVITEPDSEATASGQPNAGTVAGSTQLLKTILSTIQGAGANNVLIGAGAGTWITSYVQYIQSFASTSIAYVDMHIYPINNNLFNNAILAANIARAAGKRVTISEAWVYKIRNSELNKLSYTEIYGRDPYSFWAPIDIAFLNALADFGSAKQLIFVSPFWSHYLSAYLDYNATSAMSTADRMTASYQAVRTANLAGAFTPTGIAWLNRSIPAPDSSAPAVPAPPTATAVLGSNAYLAWTNDTDNVGVAAYRIYRNGALIGTTSLLGMNDQGLASGTNYTYTISAFDASGNVSPQSAQLKVKTAGSLVRH